MAPGLIIHFLMLVLVQLTFRQLNHRRPLLVYLFLAEKILL
jgi:hypothetical protein